MAEMQRHLRSNTFFIGLIPNRFLSMFSRLLLDAHQNVIWKGKTELCKLQVKMVKCQCMVNGVELSSMLIATKKKKNPWTHKTNNKKSKQNQTRDAFKHCSVLTTFNFVSVSKDQPLHGGNLFWQHFLQEVITDKGIASRLSYRMLCTINSDTESNNSSFYSPSLNTVILLLE